MMNAKLPKLHPHTKHLPYFELDFTQFQILGRGLAGVESVYSIPQWSLTLDIGRAPDFAVTNNTLALTHWHLDHAGGLAFLLGLRCLNNCPALKIIVPKEKLNVAYDYLKMIQNISESELRYEIHPATKNYELKKNLFLQPISTSHCLPSTGYGVSEMRSHLKNEFIGKSSDELRELKKKNI